MPSSPLPYSDNKVLAFNEQPPIAIIGYSGHAFVVLDAIEAMGRKATAYFDSLEKESNPFQLQYLGSEKDSSTHSAFQAHDYFIAIGDNYIREKVYDFLASQQIVSPIIVQHPAALVSPKAKISAGCLIGPSATLNALVQCEIGVICNSACVVEHECQIGAFAHVAPGAVLAGHVKIGTRSFIGANAVVKQGVNIGQDVVVGAGAVVIRDIPDAVTVVGNPARIIKSQ